MRLNVFRRRPVDTDECQSEGITPEGRGSSIPDDGTKLKANVDEPVTSFDDDRLDRGPFAQSVAARIDYVGTGPSVVFGLAGAWGSGKTSALWMIRTTLEDRIGGWTVVDFTPWAAGETQTLTEEFYEAIASAMPGTDTGKKARNLLMTAAPVTSAVAKVLLEAALDKVAGEGFVRKLVEAVTHTTADELSETVPDPDPFQVRFNAVSEAIRKTETKVLVVVDDLDRLHIDELLTVMKAVRLLGRFPGVHYLLSYDERTILDLLRQSDLARKDEDRARAYLEKIVQYPFELPPLQPIHLERELRDQLHAIAEQHHCAARGRIERTRREWEVVDELLNVLPSTEELTLRAIYRWCSQLDVALTLAGDNELDLIDATLITYLRLSYRKVYDILPRWKKDIVGEQDHVYLSAHPRETEEDWKAKLTGPPVKLTDSEVIGVYRLLAYLFPKLPHPMYTRFHPDDSSPRVHHDEYFDRYFSFGLPAVDISDTAVRDEVATLAATGALPQHGVLRRSLADRGHGRRLALRKVRRALEGALPDFSTETALSALEDMKVDLLNEHGDFSMVGNGAEIAALIVYRAVDSAQSKLNAQKAVNDFRRLFGLPAVTAILSIFRRGQDEYSDTKITEAMSDVRTEVLDVCMQDLTSEVPAENGRILTFLGFLTDEMWRELRGKADAAGVSQHQAAARFVADRDGWREDLQAGFRPKDFNKLIPMSEWDLRQFPPACSEEELIQLDDSLESRLTAAAYAVHLNLQSSTVGEDDSAVT